MWVRTYDIGRITRTARCVLGDGVIAVCIVLSGVGIAGEEESWEDEEEEAATERGGYMHTDDLVGDYSAGLRRRTEVVLELRQVKILPFFPL